MDSADLEPVRHAVSSQGAILGQHSTALQEIMGKLQDLSLRMETLQDSLQDPPPAPGLVASAAANPPREPWVSPPERYDGNLGQCKTFLMQCGLVFALQPLTYATERSKIAYLIGLLRGAALEWASVHWRRQDQVTTTYVAFTTEMTKVFDHPVQGNDASMRLFSLHQGLRSVAEYAIEFRTLAVESGWNDESLLAVFINGLSERLKDELVTHPEPVNLDNLIALTIRIDNRCRERRRQKQHSPASEVIPRRRDYSPAPVRSRPLPRPVLLQEPVRREEFPEGEPMQLGRNRLSTDEQERRRGNNACLYCGQPGHYIAHCPNRPLNRRAR